MTMRGRVGAWVVGVLLVVPIGQAATAQTNDGGATSTERWCVYVSAGSAMTDAVDSGPPDPTEVMHPSTCARYVDGEGPGASERAAPADLLPLLTERQALLATEDGSFMRIVAHGTNPNPRYAYDRSRSEAVLKDDGGDEVGRVPFVVSALPLDTFVVHVLTSPVPGATTFEIEWDPAAGAVLELREGASLDPPITFDEISTIDQPFGAPRTTAIATNHTPDMVFGQRVIAIRVDGVRITDAFEMLFPFGPPGPAPIEGYGGRSDPAAGSTTQLFHVTDLDIVRASFAPPAARVTDPPNDGAPDVGAPPIVDPPSDDIPVDPKDGQGRLGIDFGGIVLRPVTHASLPEISSSTSAPGPGLDLAAAGQNLFVADHAGGQVLRFDITTLDLLGSIEFSSDDPTRTLLPLSIDYSQGVDTLFIALAPADAASDPTAPRILTLEDASSRDPAFGPSFTPALQGPLIDMASSNEALAFLDVDGIHLTSLDGSGLRRIDPAADVEGFDDATSLRFTPSGELVAVETDRDRARAIDTSVDPAVETFTISADPDAGVDVDAPVDIRVVDAEVFHLLEGDGGILIVDRATDFTTRAGIGVVTEIGGGITIDPAPPSGRLGMIVTDDAIVVGDAFDRGITRFERPTLPDIIANDDGGGG